METDSGDSGEINGGVELQPVDYIYAELVESADGDTLEIDIDREYGLFLRELVRSIDPQARQVTRRTALFAGGAVTCYFALRMLDRHRNRTITPAASIQSTDGNLVGDLEKRAGSLANGLINLAAVESCNFASISSHTIGKKINRAYNGPDAIRISSGIKLLIDNGYSIDTIFQQYYNQLINSSIEQWLTRLPIEQVLFLAAILYPWSQTQLALTGDNPLGNALTALYTAYNKDPYNQEQLNGALENLYEHCPVYPISRL